MDGRFRHCGRRVTATGRGTEADTPAEIPAKGWKDIAWRVYEGFQNDRVLLVAAGVTFYALLALFPATAAVVSLYGLFADAATINEHLRLVSGFLPEGALEVIGDQVKRIASQGQATLGFAFFGTLALSLWGANAGTKAIFDALNIIYKEREKRSFIRLTLAVSGLHHRRHSPGTAGFGGHCRRSGGAEAFRHSRRVRDGAPHRCCAGRCFIS